MGAVTDAGIRGVVCAGIRSVCLLSIWEGRDTRRPRKHVTFVNTFVDTLKQTNYNYIIITVCLLFSGFNSFKCVVTVSKPEVVSPSSSVSPGALNLGTYLLSVVPGEETLLTQCLLHPLHPLQPLRGTRCPLFQSHILCYFVHISWRYVDT